MAIYVIIAIILISFYLLSTRLNVRSKTIVYIMAGVGLILLVGLRDGHINRDYRVYKVHYEKAPPIETLKSSISKYNSKIKTEFSYSALCTLIKTNGDTRDHNLFIIFFIYAILGVAANLYGIKRLTDQEFLALFIYYSSMFLLHEMTQIRAGVAIGIILISLKELQERKFVQFSILILLASFFHTSALMAFLLLLLRGFKTDAKVWAAIFVGCVIVNITQFDILQIINIIPSEFYQYKLKAYIELQDSENVELNYLNVLFILQNIIIIICFYYQEEMEKHNKYLNILLNMCCLSSCCYVFFGQIPGFAVRLNELFNCSLIILIPLIAKVMKPKTLAEALVILIGLGVFYINVFHSDLVLEYKLFKL